MNEVPFFFSPVNQESPFLLLLPAVLQPSGPALTGLIVIFSVFGLNPCHLAIDMQMCFGVKQFFRAAGVFGSDALGDQREGVRADFLRVGFVDRLAARRPGEPLVGATNFSAPFTSTYR